VTSLAGVLFDGIAYGALLFLISVGLSVTMGLMNFVNLAHGAFAMVGGYACVVLLNRFGWPFLATLPAAFLLSAAIGLVLERTLYRRLYRASHLDQVLFSMGLTSVAVAALTYVFGPAQQMIQLPSWMQGQLQVGPFSLGTYRLFLIALVLVTMVALTWLLERTRFGAEVRAAVDSPQASAGSGINVDRVFSLAFALGSGLAGLGGGLGVELLGLHPTFAYKYLVYFLLVVAVGGTSSMKGPLLAAMLLGVLDTVGKYYVPAAGAFIIYALMVLLMILFPAGLVRRAA
jgi:branched-chain amino acid transport system permease protein